jgi:Putative prokaryotic signal transducing protein
VADSELVTIRTYLVRIDADLAASALTAAGIEVLIRPDDCGGMRPHMWYGGIELLVRTEDAADAERILSEPAVWVPENGPDRSG